MKLTCCNYKTVKELSVAAAIYITWIITVIIIMESLPPHVAAIVVCFSFIPFVPCILRWFLWTAPDTHDVELNQKSQVVVPLRIPESQQTDIELASL